MKRRKRSILKSFNIGEQSETVEVYKSAIMSTVRLGIVSGKQMLWVYLNEREAASIASALQKAADIINGDL